MCGICGIAYRDGRALADEALFTRMRESLLPRGPDDAGNLIAPGVALGSRRLAILDLSANGHMPMRSSDGRYFITYNGEVFNFAELRGWLEQRGYQFRSQTDTEVVLNLYIEEGAQSLQRLNGMFAIAIWDARERTLFLARDRLGVKPLYYSLKNGDLYFASEEKALFEAGLEKRFNADTLKELLCFRYTSGAQTPFLKIERLLPGHFLIYREGSVRIERWWNLAEKVREQREKRVKSPEEWFAETLRDSVRLRKISDVPVGVLLSGGLDSSAVAVTLAAQSSSKISSFTVRFRESDYDEGPVAKSVADQWGLDYNELFIEGSEDLFPALVRALRFNDEPLVHGNEPHILRISEFAKKKVTVLLSGEGADETLGGYVRYQPLKFPISLATLKPLLGTLPASFLNYRMKKLSRFLKLSSLDRFVLYNSCEILPDELAVIGMREHTEYPYREQVLAEARSLYPQDYVRQAMYSDTHIFLCSILDRNDRMTMGASIECRVPFLDYRIVEGLAALPSSQLLSYRQSKPILRKAFRDKLPEAVRKHRKWGFSVPWTKYLRSVSELRQIVEKLTTLEPVRSGSFSLEKVKAVAQEFLSGDNSNELLVRQLVMLALWYQVQFERSYT